MVFVFAQQTAKWAAQPRVGLPVRAELIHSAVLLSGFIQRIHMCHSWTKTRRSNKFWTNAKYLLSIDRRRRQQIWILCYSCSTHAVSFQMPRRINRACDFARPVNLLIFLFGFSSNLIARVMENFPKAIQARCNNERCHAYYRLSCQTLCSIFCSFGTFSNLEIIHCQNAIILSDFNTMGQGAAVRSLAKHRKYWSKTAARETLIKFDAKFRQL